jgi:hypothetical protein
MMDNIALRHVPMGTVFQLHVAPTCYSRRVSVFLDREFPNRWVLRGGGIPRPLLSPDLTPLDFFLLRACKKTLFIVKM